MKENRWILVFAGLSLILLGICAALYLQQDREPPQIQFSASDVRYREGMDEERLLEGVTAWDERDGDVTENIVIEKVNKSSDNRYIIVVYAAGDESGNYAKALRSFDMITDLSEEGAQATEKQSADKSAKKDDADTPDEEEAAEGSEGNDTADGNAGGEEAADGEEDAGGEDTPVREEEPEEAPREERKGTAGAETAGHNPVGEADEPPTISLRTSEVTLSAGGSFDWADYIEGVTDDKDTAEQLYGNLQVSGALDMNVPGDYIVAIGVRDSGGNTSAFQNLTVHVTESR